MSHWRRPSQMAGELFRIELVVLPASAILVSIDGGFADRAKA